MLNSKLQSALVYFDKHITILLVLFSLSINGHAVLLTTDIHFVQKMEQATDKAPATKRGKNDEKNPTKKPVKSSNYYKFFLPNDKVS
jgi:hypothetical protein